MKQHKDQAGNDQRQPEVAGNPGGHLGEVTAHQQLFGRGLVDDKWVEIKKIRVSLEIIFQVYN